MRALKEFGLAALAALIAMGFLSASAAMAESTTFCAADQSPCEAANQIREVHVVSVGKAKLLSSLGTTECSVLFSGTVKKTGAPLVMAGHFIYSNCTTGCSVREVTASSTIEVLKEGHETAKVTGEGLVYVHCAEISCSYNGTGLLGTGKGPLLSAQEPDNGEVTLSEQATTKETGSLLCPKTAKLDITITPLTATYIAAPEKPEEFEETKETEGTALCSQDESPCAAGHLVNSVHEVSVGKAKLLTSLGTTECNVLFSGSIATTLASPLIVSGKFTYSNCTLGGSSCTATEENGSSEIKVSREGHETAGITGEGLVHLVCGSSIDCSYNGIGLSGTAKGPLLGEQENGEVFLLGAVQKETGGFLCPKTSALDIVTSPLTATYIRS